MSNIVALCLSGQNKICPHYQNKPNNQHALAMEATLNNILSSAPGCGPGTHYCLISRLISHLENSPKRLTFAGFFFTCDILSRSCQNAHLSKPQSVRRIYRGDVVTSGTREPLDDGGPFLFSRSPSFLLLLEQKPVCSKAVDA